MSGGTKGSYDSFDQVDGLAKPTVKLEFQDFGTASKAHASTVGGKLDRSSPANDSMDLEGESLISAGAVSSSSGPGDVGAAAGAGPMWALSYWKPFFDVDTKHILSRLFYAVWPFSTDFDSQALQPDLYGPFWIVTTLIFILGVTSNFASWVAFQGSTPEESWTYDFTRLTVGMSVIYGYMALVPAIVWGVMKYFDASMRYVEVIAIYGYSLLIFIPISVLCVVHLEWLRWLLVIFGFLYSILFVFFNVRNYLPSSGLVIIALVGIVFRAALALSFKLYLFNV